MGRRLVRWTGAKAKFLIGAVVTALIAAVVAVVVEHFDDEVRASTEASQPPVAISASYDMHADDSGIIFALPKPLNQADVEELEAPFGFEAAKIAQLEKLLAERGGVRIGADFPNDRQFTRIKLVISTTRQNSVAVSQATIKADCSDPLAGTLVFGPPQGEREVPRFGFDLDSGDPTAKAINDDGQLKGPYFSEKFIF